MSKYVILYIVFPSLEAAQRAARLAVEKKLIACANILPPITSIYQWEGKIEESQEYIALFKTLKSKVNDTTELIAANHQYQCPCIIELPIESGHEPYLAWMERQLD